jgi:predicted RNA-binding protein YlxR (DUF448 family)
LSVNERICVACRKPYCKEKLIRLTVDSLSSKIVLNQPGLGKAKVNGRSAYMCCLDQCVNLALKGNRLKFALTGRQAKAKTAKRNILWPLESQLIKDILKLCTEPEKTCQNTRVREA